MRQPLHAQAPLAWSETWSIECRSYPGQPPQTALLAGLGRGPHIAKEHLEDHQKKPFHPRTL